MRSKTKRVKNDKMNLSFNSSDVEAYKDEQPIPIVKKAWFEYQRSKRKAELRRSFANDASSPQAQSEKQIEMRKMAKTSS
mmetsp:Transcript_47352/g.62657  ORF Transcript_47352/g.62657 Transcript_47352/m.62657 type:complete len:80 (+) Transcript_47352:88-327(+)|eukprot:CAMPEP_0185606984 /NCGR_PEP_ID=MMETSP0436-20130131/5192_1 /TAXON_ID=626734 ORGANISM="Favella taraikaensis, Strain Fe Narragansett Bay" /NCGR_SAMPLE_ID=MMETSP0436 /ASSEMBLY_ACC=CAM_ASM_000390 /LENGTH=79 /DNA_ID=CAMNT_0028238765 /DNA_START=738 /DNA_END=977 /DNA_ORIENTATION=-